MLKNLKAGGYVPLGAMAVLLVAFVVLAAEFVVLEHFHVRLGNQDWYFKVRTFWEGNPSEVYSHWLDVIVMSGNALIVAWLLSAEAFFRCAGKMLAAEVAFIGGLVCTVVSGVLAMVLDDAHGEGTVALVMVIYFVPVLASSYYLLRTSAELLRWKPGAVIALATMFVFLYVGAQLFYEPSETGGPNGAIIPIWLVSVGAALGWSLMRGFRSGRIQEVVRRFDERLGCLMRK